MFLSDGVLTKSPDITVWRGTTSTWGDMPMGFQWVSYSAIYKAQLWVSTLVDKIANATARLPLKVYERGSDDERTEARDSPYAKLLRNPNPQLDPYLFWLWTVSTLNIYGEAFWGKQRDAGGRPVALLPLHPTNVSSEVDSQGKVTWSWDNGLTRVDDIARRDLVHFRLYNPDGLLRGLSPLESLRSTLENEDGARRANSALWANGARPGTVLRHPGQLSDPAHKRLRANWDEVHGSVDNWARTVILEEGMEVTVTPLNVEELQYVESRKLNREEVCARYDVPPPVVHILDRATFSNITEQMRSMYRDTMAPKLRLIESTLEMELRDGRFGEDRPPDFSENQYAEFLMDEVLRGDFEVRIPAIAQAIQTGQLTPNEGRRIENRPRVDGGDTLLVNSALVPLDALTAAPEPPVEAPPAAPDPMPMLPAPDEVPVRTLMGRLGRQQTIDEIDPRALTEGLVATKQAVLDLLDEARADGATVVEFRERLKALGGTHG